MSTKHTPKLGPVLDKFQMCAGASYAKHCKDPVASAESDLLGRALGLLKECASDLAAELDYKYPSNIRAYPSRQLNYERDMSDVEAARALLAETKEGA